MRKFKVPMGRGDIDCGVLSLTRRVVLSGNNGRNTLLEIFVGRIDLIVVDWEYSCNFR